MIEPEEDMKIPAVVAPQGCGLIEQCGRSVRNTPSNCITCVENSACPFPTDLLDRLQAIS